jgi:hypothetical protein
LPNRRLKHISPWLWKPATIRRAALLRSSIEKADVLKQPLAKNEQELLELLDDLERRVFTSENADLTNRNGGLIHARDETK